MGRGKTRFIAFIVFSLIVFAVANQYIEIIRELDITNSGKAENISIDGADFTVLFNAGMMALFGVMGVVYSMFAVGASAIAVLVFRLIAIRKTTVVTRQEFIYSRNIVLGLAAFWVLFATVLVKAFLMGVLVNGLLAGVYAIYLVALHNRVPKA